MVVICFRFWLYRNLVFVEQAVQEAFASGSGGPQAMPEDAIRPSILASREGSNQDVDEFLADIPIGSADENMDVDPEGAVGGGELIFWEFSAGLSPVVTRPLQGCFSLIGSFSRLTLSFFFSSFAIFRRFSSTNCCA